MSFVRCGDYTKVRLFARISSGAVVDGCGQAYPPYSHLGCLISRNPLGILRAAKRRRSSSLRQFHPGCFYRRDPPPLCLLLYLMCETSVHFGLDR
jgi:hypothetical protein